jgi:hypothetical protein
MRAVCSIVVILTTGCLVQAQVSDPETTDSLIKQLGNAKFNLRDQASKALMLRPDAETALRKVLTISDAETRRRIEFILDFYDRKPMRELSDHIKAGRMDEIIKRVADWPAGKYEDELWPMMQGLVSNIYHLHQKKKGEKTTPNVVNETMGRQLPPVVKADRVTESTKGGMVHMYFIRANEINLSSKGPFNNDFSHNGFPVVANLARFDFRVPPIIFAGKRVVIPDARHAIIISGGDVIIESSVCFCLIIARGSVIQTRVGAGAESNHIIAGKKVILPGPNAGNLVVEDEPNPLGFIRWSDVPKVEPKKK